MKISSTEMWAKAHEYFPFYVNYEPADMPRVNIIESAPYKWCVERFGPRASSIRRVEEDGTSPYCIYNPDAGWDVVSQRFFFKTEADAALFKVMFLP